MKQKLINAKNYPQTCENCFYGRMSDEKDCVLCVKKGVMDKSFSCKKYKYDPLKRQPKRRKPLEKYTEEDFKL